MALELIASARTVVSPVLAYDREVRSDAARQLILSFGGNNGFGQNETANSPEPTRLPQGKEVTA
jgi:hypothetical protein